MDQSTIYICYEDNRRVPNYYKRGFINLKEQISAFPTWEQVRAWVKSRVYIGRERGYVFVEKPMTEASGSRIPTVDELLEQPRDLTITMYWDHQMNLENWYDIIIKAISLTPPPANQHLMTMPVGDFSMDGHEVCMEYLVQADKPYQDVRDAHFRIKEVTGIDLHGFAADDRDDIIPKEVLDRLYALGFEFLATPLKDAEGTHLTPQDHSCDNAEVMANIWVFLLNKVDPGLHVRIVKNPPVPSLLFSGPDEKGRLSDSVGYGCFWSLR